MTIDATHLLQETALGTMKDEAGAAPVIRCALDEKTSPLHAEPSSRAPFSDPPFLTEESRQVCSDPPIWVFDDMISESVLERVNNAFEGIEWQPLNGRQVRMVELCVDEQLAELTQTLREISHIDDVAPCGKAWIMDVVGRDQGPHLDGWEVEKNRGPMQLLDLSRCSVQCHKGFNTVIPTLSFVVYFSGSGGIAFPQADLPNPFIPAKRGRILMFQNYDDLHRPAHNPKAVHYGVYGDSPKRVMTAGVMSSETPAELSGPSPAGVPRTKGFLYAPIMHRANTSCGSPSTTPPPRPKPTPKPKERVVLQLLARPADAGGFIVEATSVSGNVMAKALVEEDSTLGSLRASLGVDARLVSQDELLDGPDDTLLKLTSLLRGMSLGDAEAGQSARHDERDASGHSDAAAETLVEWDVIDTVFVKKEAPPASKAPSTS
mmetsp:Transcript_78704/g.218638  ORF Transcript_78704/g.218638 Transcript_78704/m.218638 type:complete len:434 (+) Transcript_78704:109-1410(+)